MPTRDDLSEVDFGNVGADVVIADPSGNPIDGLHDESENPGLDDVGFETLTSLDGFAGAYVTTPQVHSTPGSNWYLWQYVECTNRAAEAVTRTLMRICRKPIWVDTKTGYILPTEAEQINSQVNAAVSAAIGASVSGHSFAISRTDNLLQQNAIITGAETIVPLAYPAGAKVTLAFSNPAQGQAV